jgi:AcrR family transcriptional regulator
MARPRSDIDARIVHAARNRFLREGVDGASLRTIARDAGTSIGMVYYYFPTKDELFFAVVEEIYASILADMARALEPDVPVEERLRRLFRRLAALSEVELATLRLVVREVLVSSSRLDRLIGRFQRGHIPLVLATLSEGMRDGSIDAGRHIGLVLIATIAMGAMPQVMRRVAGERLPLGDLPSGDAFTDALIDLLFSGIGAGARRRERPERRERKPRLRRR